MAALLFTVDKAWRDGWTARVPTSRECEWKGKKVKESLVPAEVKDYNWSSPHFQKKGQFMLIGSSK